MKAHCEIETYEFNGKDVRTGATNGKRECLVVETAMLSAAEVRVRIGDATAVVNASDLVRAVRAASLTGQ